MSHTRPHRRVGVLLLAAGLLLLSGIAQAASFPIVGKVPKDFTLDNSWGHKDNLYMHRGKVVIMNFGNHKSEQEAVATFILAARQYYKDPKVKMISMIVLKDLPFYANKKVVYERVKEIGRNISYPELGGTMDWQGKVSKTFGVDNGPNLVVIDKKGKVVFMMGSLEKGAPRAFRDAVEKAKAAK